MNIDVILEKLKRAALCGQHSDVCITTLASLIMPQASLDFKLAASWLRLVKYIADGNLGQLTSDQKCKLYSCIRDVLYHHADHADAAGTNFVSWTLADIRTLLFDLPDFNMNVLPELTMCLKHLGVIDIPYLLGEAAAIYEKTGLCKQLRTRLLEMYIGRTEVLATGAPKFLKRLQVPVKNNEALAAAVAILSVPFVDLSVSEKKRLRFFLCALQVMPYQKTLPLQDILHVLRLKSAEFLPLAEAVAKNIANTDLRRVPLCCLVILNSFDFREAFRMHVPSWSLKEFLQDDSDVGKGATVAFMHQVLLTQNDIPGALSDSEKQRVYDLLCILLEVKLHLFSGGNGHVNMAGAASFLKHLRIFVGFNIMPSKLLECLCTLDTQNHIFCDALALAFLDCEKENERGTDLAAFVLVDIGLQYLHSPFFNAIARAADQLPLELVHELVLLRMKNLYEYDAVLFEPQAWVRLLRLEVGHDHKRAIVEELARANPEIVVQVLARGAFVKPNGNLSNPGSAFSRGDFLAALDANDNINQVCIPARLDVYLCNKLRALRECHANTLCESSVLASDEWKERVRKLGSWSSCQQIVGEFLSEVRTDDPRVELDQKLASLRAIFPQDSMCEALLQGALHECQTGAAHGPRFAEILQREMNDMTLTQLRKLAETPAIWPLASDAACRNPCLTFVLHRLAGALE